MNSIKPIGIKCCPFCGGHDVEIEKGAAVSVHCYVCGLSAYFGTEATAAEAISRWNARFAVEFKAPKQIWVGFWKGNGKIAFTNTGPIVGEVPDTIEVVCFNA